MHASQNSEKIKIKNTCPPVEKLSYDQVVAIIRTGINPCGYKDRELKRIRAWFEDPMYSTGVNEKWLRENRPAKRKEFDYDAPENFDSWGRRLRESGGY